MTYLPSLFDMPDDAYVRRRCVVCGVATSIVHTHTYVVQRQVWIKVGATSRPRKRIQELSLYSWHKYVHSPRGMDWTQPLHRLALVERDIEHELHVRLAEYHAVGEWFWDSPNVRRIIQEVTP